MSRRDEGDYTLADGIVDDLLGRLFAGTLTDVEIKQLVYWIRYTHQLRASQNRTGSP